MAVRRVPNCGSPGPGWVAHLANQCPRSDSRKVWRTELRRTPTRSLRARTLLGARLRRPQGPRCLRPRQMTGAATRLVPAACKPRARARRAVSRAGVARRDCSAIGGLGPLRGNVSQGRSEAFRSSASSFAHFRCATCAPQKKGKYASPGP